jgi:predicted Zn finger-like uncharacterized protein
VYTQCSKCETVFKLSAEVLRTAGGQVRCGNCGEVFNALARLAEDSSAFATGESPLDLEARADSILESAAPQVAHVVAKEHEDFAPPGVEMARLEFIDTEVMSPPPAAAPPTAAPPAAAPPAAARPAAEEPDDRSLEFTLPPGELDRIFVESKKRVVQPPQTDVELDLPPHPESAAAEPLPARGTGLEVPEEVRRDMLEGVEHKLLPASEFLKSGRAGRSSAASRRQFIAWLGAAIVSALLLLIQFVHQNREWFVTHAHGPFEGIVRAMYGALGSPLPPPASLSAYQLRQWGVTGDPDANGTLRLRASILNTAAQLQPYPLLRVTLADRFGKSIGRRDFEPAEYLGKPTAKLLAPGERADATLTILDPGKNAEGFEIDVCLRGVDSHVSCANDVAAQTKR